jgi:hypothetical protein
MTHRRSFALAATIIGVIGLVGTVPSFAAPNLTAVRGAAPFVDRLPETAQVQFVLANIANVNLGAGTFDATYYLGLTCSAECRQVPWETVNALLERQVLASETETTSWWKVSATLAFDPDLLDYPFDTQTLPISVESTGLDASRLTLQSVDSASGEALSTPVAGWASGTPSVTTSVRDYAMLGEQYSQARFELPIKRSVIATILNFYLPLSAFLLLGIAVLSLKRSDYHIRVAGTALVGLTIFYLATSRGVAAEGQLSVWDLSLVLSYLVLVIILLTGVVGARNFQGGKYEGADGEALENRVRRSSLIVALAVLGIGVIGIPLYALA